MVKYVSYYRVSTKRQGHEGLGVQAQRAACRAHVTKSGGSLIAEYTEVESGKRADRPQLALALAAARQAGATLLVAKLDRLARDVLFLATVIKGGTEFLALDVPTANRLTLHVLAAVAEDEARRISERTRSALAAAKAAGKKLGNPQNLDHAARLKGAAARKAAARSQYRYVGPIIIEWRKSGQSYAQIAARLNEIGGEFSRSGRGWAPMQVARAYRYVTEP